MFWLTAALLLFWAIGAYNRLVRLRSIGLAAFTSLGARFDQCIALVRTHLPCDATVALADAASRPDEALAAAWAALGAATDQFHASLKVARGKPLNAPTANALKTAYENLVQLLGTSARPAARSGWRHPTRQHAQPVAATCAADCLGPGRLQCGGRQLQPGHQPVSGVVAGCAVCTAAGAANLMDSPAPTIALWQQLQAVATVLQAIRGGSSGTAAIARVAAELRPGVQALSFHVLRRLARAEALRRLLARRAPAPAVDALLCSALALAWQAQDAPYPVFTLVNQAVEAANRNVATRAQARFINACLRRFLRERDALVAVTEQDPVVRWNHPQWWIDRLHADWPQHWQAILAADNRQPPMTLRVNARRAGVAQYLQTLQDAGLNAVAAGPHGVTLEQARPVQQLPGFMQGVVSVQDAAAQLAAPLLLSGLAAAQPLRVLDACAAPGGKTAHLLELAGCQVTALDIDPLRCQRIEQTLQRLQLQAEVLVADAATGAAWWNGQPFDAILLDAPCSASGIVRRHPDILWLRREADIAQLARQQAALLKALWPLLRAGGRLLYCTCSVFRAEGEFQIQTFLAHNTDATLLPSPGHLLPSTGANDDGVPDNLGCDHDGFYYALLEKRPA